MPQIRNRVSYIDISPDWTLQPGVFPGDIEYKRSFTMSFEKDHLELSSFESTFHIGAHADAPCHYSPKGTGLEARDLNVYMGEVQVIEVNIAKDTAIEIEDIKDKIKAQRVLFKTSSFNYQTDWSSDFNFFSSATIEWLAKQEVILVGIDTPSVDSATSKEMPAHKMIFKYDLAILEGINLKKAKSGLYQLIALPLPIKEVDATPVRAILIQN